MHKHLFLFILFLNISSKLYAQEPQKWIQNPFSKSQQVLLTNEAKFKNDAQLVGGSSFLIDYKNKTYAITAKHLLGDAGGVFPAILPSEFDKQCINWKLYARNSTQNDSIFVEKIVTKDDNPEIDIIIFLLKNNTSTIYKLKPRLTPPQIGENLYLIGCLNSDKNCNQNIYEMPVNVYFGEGKDIKYPILGLNAEKFENINFQGFSGAPIVDKNGEVVGMLTGKIGVYTLTAVPMIILKKYLK